MKTTKESLEIEILNNIKRLSDAFPPSERGAIQIARSNYYIALATLVASSTYHHNNM